MDFLNFFIGTDIVEVTRINDILEKFKEESSDAVIAWEVFKKIFGLDR